MKQLLSLLLALAVVVFSVLGIVDAGFITYEELSGRVPPCNPIFKCGEVLKSQWAHIGPVPLAALGVLFYSTFFVLGVLNFMDVKKITVLGRSFPLPLLMLIQGCFGFLFSMYLVFLMAVIIKAWCFYCILSALNCLILFSLSILNYRMLKYRK